jgi:hypothetical protein
MRRDRRLDAGAPSPHERRSGVAGGDLRQRLVVVGPGKTTGPIKQPIAMSVADAAADGARSEHRLGKAYQRRRRKLRGVADRNLKELMPVGSVGQAGNDASISASIRTWLSSM